LKPERPAEVTEKAIKVHGIKRQTMQKFPHRSEAYRKLMRIIRKYVSGFSYRDKFMIVGYNVQFDIDFFRIFLNRELSSSEESGKYEFQNFFFNTGIDILPVLRFMAATGRMPMPSNFKQTTVAKLLNVAKYQAHSALSDIEVTRLLKRYLEDGLQDTNFKSDIKDTYGLQAEIFAASTRERQRTGKADRKDAEEARRDNEYGNA